MKEYIAPNHLLPFYLANQVELNINSYNLCFSYLLDCAEEVHLLIAKLHELVLLRADLRQTFSLENNRLIGRIHPNLPPEVHFFNSSQANLAVLEKTLVKELADLNSQSSIKLNIIKIIETDKYLALFNINHILLDGYGLEQFIKELNLLLSGHSLQEVTTQHYLLQIEKELMLEENVNLPGKTEYLKSIENISSKIDGFGANPKSEVFHYCLEMPTFLVEKLNHVSKEQEISLFNLLLLAWSIFTAKLVNQNSILVSYPVNIRKNEFNSGCFINTAVFPLILKNHDSSATLIHSLRKRLPFLKRLAKQKIEHHSEKINLVNFANSNFTKVISLVLNGKSFEGNSYDQIGNSYLSVKYRKDSEGKIIFGFDILSGIFPEFTANTLLHRYFNFINKMLNNYDSPLASIDLTFENERTELLYQFNQTERSFPSEKTLVDLFEEQVEKTPESIALVYENIKITYKELNSKSNQLAHYLMNDHQVKPDDLIALFLERNQYTIIAILAILKTGGAYVPLDLSYPQERVKYILEDTQVRMVLINEIHQDKIHSILYPEYAKNNENIDVISIDNLHVQHEINKQSVSNIITADISTNLAYVIYTSGTTGKPKGVMIEHRSVVNTLYSLLPVYKHETASPSKITAFTSYAFDVSVSEFFIALIQGDELHLLSESLRKDIILTSQYISERKINYLYLPPVLLANFPRIKYPSLKAIIYAGEPCDKETASYWSRKTKLYNYYGPTEASIYATGLQIQTDEVNLIGKPINNIKIYVLDAKRLLQPIGLVGELYIGGHGLAKGYLHNRDLTEERFINNPFQTEEEKILAINSRLYRTGDLVRWLPDGTLEYLGRNDFQIKIRGYRVELGEIESALTNFPDIKQAIVLSQNDENENAGVEHKYLIGYYVANKKIEDQLIRDFLKLYLPDFMHPSILIHLKSLPVTPNGKLDRNALPKPELLSYTNYIPPTNNKEIIICDAFSKILKIDKTGIEDDFFCLGGTSILAIKLVLSLQASFDIKVIDIYNLRTPKKIAREILFTKDNLKKSLLTIQSYYQNKLLTPFNKESFQKKIDGYFQSIHDTEVNLNTNPITNVLLTGATGFLGCNLLNTLLHETDYSIFLIIRAESDQSAFERINKKFEFYFNTSLHSAFNKRLFVFAGDIEKKDLGIPKLNYLKLVEQIDSIIHSAALTKHYGDYDTFYLANVQATRNLLELCVQTKLKQFHHISTKSVLNEINASNSYYIFTEEDMGDNLTTRSNIYVKTKYESEKIVLKYRKHGVNSNIYRVGNLAFIASTQRGQENIEDNGFFTRLRCLLNLKMVAEEVSNEELSPTDLTAQAIIKLFDKVATYNQIYHVFNPFTCDWGNMIAKESTKVNYLSIKKFIATIVKNLGNPIYQQSIELFLLHQRWLNEEFIDTSRFCILQNKTHVILNQLGFEWIPISKDIFIKFLQTELEREKKGRYS